jgi:hypothetical protein
MSLKILPPKLENLNSFPENIKVLLIKLFEEKESKNRELILSNFFKLNSENINIKNIFEKLKFDKNKNTFSNPLDLNNIYSVFKNELSSNNENTKKNEEKEKKKEIIIPKLKEEKNEKLRRSTRIRYKRYDEDEIIYEDQFRKNKKTLLKKKRKELNINKLNSSFSQSENSDNLNKKNILNSRTNTLGLKEISNKVKEIMKRKGQTTYKEISDEIVSEIKGKGIKDEKNIRRRIYDALNVMKSINLFQKEKGSKKIMWNYSEGKNYIVPFENNNIFNKKNYDKDYYDKINDLNNDISIKKKTLKVLSKELNSLKFIIDRNKKNNINIDENTKIYFPFLIIEFPKNLNNQNEDEENKIKVSMNENRTKAHFGFNAANKLYGDLDALSKIRKYSN